MLEKQNKIKNEIKNKIVQKQHMKVGRKRVIRKLHPKFVAKKCGKVSRAKEVCCRANAYTTAAVRHFSLDCHHIIQGVCQAIK